ncbi:cellulose binding domain-containing protein [Streptomyces apocyni]|uniref:cellulose binding domain-containing protein n=1 Tax=Streptomyces apocyni TaxID=2654677 RepID=UPI0018D08FD5|nr:cellulose binding domain-containing protein [Streptomyces apocyni]
MRHPPRFSRSSRLLTLLVGAALALAGTLFVPAVTASGAAPVCSVVYETTSEWDDGFQGSVTVTHHGPATDAWTLGFDFPGGQEITQGWNAQWSQSGSAVTAKNAAWNGALDTGASVTAGFLASWSGTNPVPTSFTLNGAVCNEDDDPDPDPTDPDPDPTDPPDPEDGPPALKVSGNQLVDSEGAPRRLLGVNRSGGEFACVQGYGIFDGPVDDASIQAIADWNVNAVRIPLNEECWLGLDNIDPRYAGGNYTTAIKDLVRRVEDHGMTPIVELHWSWGQYTGNSSGCSDIHASCQKPMPNAQYSKAFWSSVASTFKDDPAVVFDLFNEPYPDRATPTAEQAWTCWRDGGDCPGITYEVAGMQSLVDAVRDTGAQNVILVSGLAYSNDLSQWLSYAPSDPAGNLAAAWHVYNFNACVSESCWEQTLAPVAAQVPLVAGEIGENTCGHSFVDRVMRWFDDRDLSYLGWTWNTWDCSAGPALIRDYDGTPTAYGIGLRDHLLALGDGSRDGA